jgi:hypothetical protein
MIDIPYLHPCACIPLNISPARTGIEPYIIVYVNIIDDHRITKTAVASGVDIIVP